MRTDYVPTGNSAMHRQTDFQCCRAGVPPTTPANPEGNGVAIPEKHGDTNPEGNGDTNPEENGDTIPEENGDTSPEENGDTSPEENGDTSPATVKANIEGKKQTGWYFCEKFILKDF